MMYDIGNWKLMHDIGNWYLMRNAWHWLLSFVAFQKYSFWKYTTKSEAMRIDNWKKLNYKTISTIQ